MIELYYTMGVIYVLLLLSWFLLYIALYGDSGFLASLLYFVKKHYIFYLVMQKQFRYEVFVSYFG